MERIMENRKVIEEFLRAAFLLGTELLDKDNLTDREKAFLKQLDKVGELIFHK
jgi:hypothetical protein